MDKAIVSKKTARATPLFYLRIPADSPQMHPDPTMHLGLAAGHLQDQINTLDTVENLGAIDEENSTVRAITFAITAVLENLREVHRHFTEVIALIKPAGKECGTALSRRH